MDHSLSQHHAEEWIFNNAFSTTHMGRIGIEIEWLLIDPVVSSARPNPIQVHAIVCPSGGDLPHGGKVTFEPGGQLELSTAVAASLTGCVDAAARDLAVIRHRLDTAGLRLIGSGLDSRPPRRVTRAARYAALEASYDLFGSIGRIMMCNTASVQVNIDAGDDSDGWRGRQRRWWLANSLGPMLAAMFANSPRSSIVSGRSCRQILRFRTDPSRTDPVTLSGDCRTAWTRYALDAQVTGISMGDSQPWLIPAVGFTMRRWLRGEGPRPVTLDDLRWHLKTINPPVRACGHLELRMIDTQADDNWVVPTVVVAALLDDPVASQQAFDVVDKLPAPEHRGDWIVAAQYGLAHPDLGPAAQALMRIALDALDRLDVPARARQTVTRFADRYTERGRCPADDWLPP